MGLRKPPPPNPELERLREERIDLQVQLSMLQETPKPNPGEIDHLGQKLVAVEAQISLHAKDPKRWNWATV
jgi:hypothetical protein